MLTLDQIKEKIENNLAGSKVIMFDPRNDGIHIKARVIWSGFAGKTLVEQHRMVYDILKDELKEEIHALGLETKVEE